MKKLTILAIVLLGLISCKKEVNKKVDVSKLLNQVYKDEVKKKKIFSYCWMSFIVVLIVVSYSY